jgi:hypothetical protein
VYFLFYCYSKLDTHLSVNPGTNHHEALGAMRVRYELRGADNRKALAIDSNETKHKTRQLGTVRASTQVEIK